MGKKECESASKARRAYRANKATNKATKATKADQILLSFQRIDKEMI